MLGFDIPSASMASLLPRFKCLPDSLPLSKSTPHHQSKSKEYLRVQCVLSSTAVVKPEKLQIPSFESLTASVTSVKPLTYIGGAAGPPLEEEICTKLPSQGSLENEDSVLAVAAAEAVALARAAVKTAKDAAQMAGGYSLKQGTEDALSEVEVLQLEMARLFAKESNEEVIRSNATEAQTEAAHSDCSSNVEPDTVRNGSSFLEVQESEDVTVKSTRQTERRTRRLHALENKRVDDFSTCSVPYRKKSHAKSHWHDSPSRKSQQFESSDPVAYLLPTIREHKLLTAKEEVELSLGIQDFLKLQRLKEELTAQNGSEPKLSQWAAAAGVSQVTLRKRIDYGTFCRDKMVYSNLRLVIKIARKYEHARVGLDFHDLVQEGCRGLITGCERFDGLRGFKFSTYATWWIKQSIKKGLSDNSRFIRLPEVLEDTKVVSGETSFIEKLTLKELYAALDKLRPREREVVRLRYGLEGSKEMTLQEIGEVLGVSRERVRQLEVCAFRKMKNKSSQNFEDLQEILT